MLILQRKKEQSLSIGDNITITILETGNDWVKLAIDAPREVPILRTELKEAASFNEEAVSVPLTESSIFKINNLIKKCENNGDT